MTGAGTTPPPASSPVGPAGDAEALDGADALTSVNDPGDSEAEPVELGPEDAKLVTLARAARARAGVREGAAVRDDDGRTYAAATVSLPSLRLTALQAAVAAAVASGAQALEAAVVVGQAPEIDPASHAVAADLGTPVLILAGPDGVVRRRTTR